MSQLTKEMGLAEMGLIDMKTAAKVGNKVKVDWVVFGSYVHEQEQPQ